MDNVKVWHRNQIDKKLWDTLVVQSGGALFSTYDYLSSCEGDWEAIIFTDDEKYICAAPFPYRKKNGIKYIYQSPIACYFTLLTSSAEAKVRDDFAKKWLAHLNSYSYVAKYFLKEIESIHLDNFKVIKCEGLQIDLRQSYQEILAGFSKHRKIRLKQTRVSNQQVNKLDDLSLFVSLHEKYTTPKINSLHPGQLEVMRLLWAKLLQNDQLEFYFSEVDREMLGGVLLGKFGTTIYSLASFSSNEGRKMNSMTLLMDHILKRYAQTSYTCFDLGNMAVGGIDEFKISFGATRYSFYQVYRNNLPWIIRIPKSILNFFGMGVG